MSRKFKLNIGDVFIIPLGNGEFGFGQIVTPYDKKSGGFMMAVFKYKVNDLTSIFIEKICHKDILLLGFTFDAKIYHKDWTIIGNYTSNIGAIIMPYYRLGTPPGELFIVNYKGERIIEIDEDVFKLLSYKTEIAPIRYENALKAYYKLQEWKEEDYDKLLYTNAIESKKLVENIHPSSA